MKRIFISHPFRNDPAGNAQKISTICERLAKLDIAYFSPIDNYQALDDLDAKQREYALRCCKEWIKHCDEVWFFGDWQPSQGCQMEFQAAKWGIKTVRFITGWDGDAPVFQGERPRWLKLAEGS